ncbi:hypothetical protein HOY82DRAFT_614385 [Tuber indicum]|nr:hypothetical protein HOY82DRAFT_614385 [Tuber indicum]
MHDYVGGFAVVGGAVLLLHGATIQTRDADFGITAGSRGAFARAAGTDSRFTQPPLGWEYSSTFGINVGTDFVQIASAYLHQLQAYCLDETLPVVDGGCKKNRLQFVVGMMVRKGQNFRGLGSDLRELLGEIIEGLD